MKISKTWIAVATIFVVIVIDQIIKIAVKTSMYWGEDIEIFSWFHLRFVQNNGMAFGMEFGSKLFLTLFRIVAVGVLCWIICRLCKRDIYPKGLVASVALITAGAAGNIFDCIFYGEIFTNPLPPVIAQLVPWGEGYSTLFHGLVVDMFYFPLFSFNWPDWLPLIGGKTFSFFDPVFNFADAAITVGMAILIIFYSKYLGGTHEKGKETPTDTLK